jgi:hypothetical protein
MVVVLERLFIVDLHNCPADFQLKFRKVYQQLKVVDNPQEVKGVCKIERNFYTLIIDRSRIALRVSGATVTIGNFLFNQFYESK